MLRLGYRDPVLVLVLEGEGPKGQREQATLTSPLRLLFWEEWQDLWTLKTRRRVFLLRGCNWGQKGNVLRARCFFPRGLTRGQSVRNLGSCGDEWLLCDSGPFRSSVSAFGGSEGTPPPSWSRSWFESLRGWPSPKCGGRMWSCANKAAGSLLLSLNKTSFYNLFLLCLLGLLWRIEFIRLGNSLILSQIKQLKVFCYRRLWQ